MYSNGFTLANSCFAFPLFKSIERVKQKKGKETDTSLQKEKNGHSCEYMESSSLKHKKKTI